MRKLVSIAHTNYMSAGNTCFVNVALQCLRYTPKLPQAIYPDLVRFSLIEQQPVAMPVSPDSCTAAIVNAEPSHSGSELPSVPETTAVAQVQISNPSATLNSQAEGPALSGLNSNNSYPQHSMHSTGQAHLNSNDSAEPQQSVHSMSQQSQIPMSQLLQDQTAEHPDLHPSQPVSIPPSHTGIAPHSCSETSPQEQLPSLSPDRLTGTNLNSLASSDTSNHTVSVLDSPGGVLGTSSPIAAGERQPLLQQQQQQQLQGQQQQLPGDAAQQMATTDSTPGDDSEKAPPNQSTAARQPPPVAVPRVPLKKGEIAESFRTLVKQVTGAPTTFTVLCAVTQGLSLAFVWHVFSVLLSVVQVCVGCILCSTAWVVVDIWHGCRCMPRATSMLWIQLTSFRALLSSLWVLTFVMAASMMPRSSSGCCWTACTMTW